MKPEEALEYGIPDTAKVGLRVKEAPGLGPPETELPEWEDLKLTILQAVLRRLQSIGRFR